MAAYTPSLRLTLPVTGTESGTWGDTVNNGITSLTDASIAGTSTVVQGDVANYTLTNNSGATDEARNMFLNITGALTAARNVICPSVSKLYFIKNSTTGGFAVTLKTSGGTGISVPNGGTAVALYCDGVNVVNALTYAPSVPNALTAGTGLTATATYNGAAAVTFNATGSTLNSQTSAYVLLATDAGKSISITTGGVTCPSSVLAAGDIVTIYNNSGSSQTITQGASLTLQWAGQTASTTGTRTLGLYGLATVLYISPTVAVISGAGVA